jgi:SDR family mycofactocin-dependent oxidoreductase
MSQSVTTMKRLKGKVAIVTGGARGQGRAHAVALAREGADVVICDVDGVPEGMEIVTYDLASADDLHATVGLVEEADGRCLPVVADVRDREGMRSVADAAAKAFGPADILCANAGILAFGALTEADDRVWDLNVAVNLTGVYNAIRAVLPSMMERGSGRIIATSSAGGRIGYPNLTGYCAAKWGVIGLVKSLALEVAPTGVTVNGIIPGMVDSAMINNPSVWRLFRPDLENPGRNDVMEAWVGLTPNGAGPTAPEEISKAVVFLASDDAQQITGTTIDISSGQSGRYTA